tara:strand:+ start:1527 stop:1670 length:144 start_codon:yes stop_codon:yes gene_type:complete
MGLKLNKKYNIIFIIEDNFIHCNGTQEDLLIKYGINFDSISREKLKI